MRNDVAEALRRLRAADPAARVADERWTGSAAEALTRAPEGEHSVDAVPPTTRRTRRWPAVLAAAAVVAGISVAAVELSDGHGASRRPLAAPTGSPSHSQPAPPVGTTGSGSTTNSTPPTPTGPDPHQLEAVRFVRHLLRAAPVLPGAQRRTTAPNSELRRAAGAPRTTGTLVHLGNRWFTAPGTMDEAIAYLRAHVPAGMKFDGSGTGSRYGVITSESISYSDSATGNVRDAYLNIFVAPYRGGIGLGMYATAYWVPTRPPGSQIDGATSVMVTVRRGGAHPEPHSPHAPTVHRTLTGPVVATLARAVNRLQPAYIRNEGCPAGLFKFDDTLVFATPVGPVRAFDTLTGCGGVALGLADGRRLELQSGNLDAAVLHALGLPRRYGSG
jgi:hypothetical protein